MKEVKKKTSSGCLIINNKVTDSVDLGEFETKKRGLDVFEFDEYDGLDDNRYMKDADDGRYRWIDSNRKSGERMESRNGETSRSEVEDDEADLPLSVLRKKYRLSSGKSIRLQGKNGVLKVMVNKDKQMGVSRSGYDHAMGDNPKETKPKVVHEKVLDRDGRDGQTSVNEDAKKKKSEMKLVKNGGNVKQIGVSRSGYDHAVADNQEETKPKVVHERNLRRDDRDGQTSVNEDAKKKKSEMKSVKKVSKIKKEMKVKRGSGTTEKQILREKIKDMLVAGGWSIDYRPRRGRDYMDAVYISPSGTGYWSIVKAYDVFQKEEKNDFKDGGGKVTPLREEIQDKLTRQGHKTPENGIKTYSRRSRKIGRCSLLVRAYDNKVENGDGFVPYTGKRTLLSWLVDSGVVRLREHVEYMHPRKTRVLQKGWITKDGIHCSCCSKIVTVSKFEAHAGSKVGQPFTNMFLESGKSLMQCQIDAWDRQGELERTGFYSVDVDGDDPNDDTCGLCGDGGDLICCDGCPSTFHQTCLDLPMLPQGDWLCPNCTCKYCEKIACTNATQDSLLTCYLCQKKYHESCSPETNVKPSESDYSDLSFCGHACHELYSQLQKLVGVKQELGSGFSWSLLHRSELPRDASSVELSQRVECNSMLAVAMSVMDECFLPFTDRRSEINLIRNVVFNCGSNLSRLNYSGFYTAILERVDEIVCAASIRIHGTKLAEMPFIGTRHLCRRRGMCRRLLSAIEAALSSLQVEKLIIPAVPEHMDTWTDVFGFQPLEESDKQQLKCMNMLVFPKTDMLQKALEKVKTDSGSQESKHSISVDESTSQEANASVALEKVKTDSGSQESKHSVSVDESTSQEANASVTPCEPEGMESVSVQKPIVEETGVQNVNS
ncbi:putative histone acetyltransferase chromatin regulator PHD family [Helianthus annuus]|uniref:Histone acetyltransferase chromatin regulator PHD family n=1 Tax=Helianthus annuus TaxID=4232 RepID=A0A251UJW9_HELAN|nr:increased DNA methylation 1 [Helianthus annuus]KAF5803121.1 putative histone acetyltransferase chromatin regulator PHD family [Helianthus annuus]